MNSSQEHLKPHHPPIRYKETIYPNRQESKSSLHYNGPIGHSYSHSQHPYTKISQQYKVNESKLDKLLNLINCTLNSAERALKQLNSSEMDIKVLLKYFESDK
jgi:hypothetical protein